MKFLNKIDGADKLVTDVNNRLVTDIEKGVWNSKQEKLEAGANIQIAADGKTISSTNTNTTYTEISEAEINTGTASTRRTITARRITFIINKIKGMLTKADVGLSDVDNTSDVNKPVATTTTNGIMSSTDKISLNANTAVRHSHSNKAVLDRFDESGTQLRYNGEVVAIETVYTWAKLKGSMSWGNFLGQ